MTYFIGKILIGLVILGLLFCAYQMWRFFSSVQKAKHEETDDQEHQEHQEHNEDDIDNWSDF